MSETVVITPLALGTRLTLRAGCVLLEDAGVRVLVDPGHFGTRGALDAALQRAAGIGVAELDIVYFTHLHFDHYDDLAFDDVPRVLMPAREKAAVDELMRLRHDAHAYCEGIRAAHHSVAPIFMRQFLRLASDARYDFERVSFREGLHLVEAGECITPRLRTIDLPGHSVGQLGLAMTTCYGRTVVAGDAALSVEDYQQPDIGHHLVVFDADQLMATRRRLAEFDCVVPGHGAWFCPRTGQLVGAAQEECNV